MKVGWRLWKRKCFWTGYGLQKITLRKLCILRRMTTTQTLQLSASSDIHISDAPTWQLLLKSNILILKNTFATHFHFLLELTKCSKTKINLKMTFRSTTLHWDKNCKMYTMEHSENKYKLFYCTKFLVFTNSELFLHCVKCRSVPKRLFQLEMYISFMWLWLLLLLCFTQKC